jgi:hypothetical protein
MNIEKILALPFYFWVISGTFFIGLVGFVICTVLSYQKLELMENLLNKCALITSSRANWSDSRYGRMIRLHAIFVAVTFQKLSQRRGVIDGHQVSLFPRNLRCHVQAGYMMMCIACVVGVTVYWVAKEFYS